MSTITLGTLKQEVRDYLADVSEERWNEREVVTAINNAVRTVYPKWHTLVIKESGDDGASDPAYYDETVFEISMPTGMDDVVEMYLAPKRSDRPYKQISDWSVRSSTIYLRRIWRGYDGNAIRYIGVIRPAEFLAVKGQDGVTDGTTTFSSTGDVDWTDALADYIGGAGDLKMYVVESSNNNAAVGEYDIASIDSSDNLTLVQSPTTATSCHFVVVDPTETTDIPYPYLLNMTSHFLYMQWFNRGVGKDTNAAATKAQYYEEKALLELEEERKRHTTRNL